MRKYIQVAIHFQQLKGNTIELTKSNKKLQQACVNENGCFSLVQVTSAMQKKDLCNCLSNNKFNNRSYLISSFIQQSTNE